LEQEVIARCGIHKSVGCWAKLNWLKRRSRKPGKWFRMRERQGKVIRCHIPWGLKGTGPR